MQMPEMNGAEFFEKAQRINELLTRIALLASPKKKIYFMLSTKENMGVLSKLWDQADLTQTLIHASCVHKEKVKNQLLKELEKKNTLLDEMTMTKIWWRIRP